MYCAWWDTAKHNQRAKTLFSSEGRESDDDAEDDPVTKKMVVVDDEIEETCGSWAVVVGSFFNMFLSLGTGLAVAPMVVEWLRTFNMGQEVTAWVGSINLGVLFLLGSLCYILESCMVMEAFTNHLPRTSHYEECSFTHWAHDVIATLN